MIIIDTPMLDGLSQQATIAVRQRQGCNFHATLSDPLQRMLNAFEPGTYVRPHRHWEMQKREVFVILRGQLLVILFDDDGQVIQRIVLDANKGIHAVEIAPHEWHMATALEPGTVVYEIKDGPYNVVTDKQFAPWAPDENDPTAREWMNRLLKSFI